MNMGRFEVPVTLLVGLGYPLMISTALSALKFLEEQPGVCRQKATAIAACRAVIEGRTVPSTARFALVAYAMKKDIILDETVNEAMMMAKKRAYV